uniref:DUF1741 domain-containing protein n=1 Tax=Rhabditophanes sp. KR3021 TaxID=114890 RepID=A0AC35U6P4_9BILA
MTPCLKIVTLYNQLYDDPSLIDEDFNWSEFFLLKYNEENLIKVLRTKFEIEENFKTNCDVTHRIVERAIKFVAVGSDHRTIRNASQTLRIVVKYILANFDDDKRWEIICNHYSFSIFGAFSIRLTIFLRENTDLDIETQFLQSQETQLVLLQTAIELITATGNVQDNRLIPVFLQSDLSNALHSTISTKSKATLDFKVYAVKFLSHLLSFSLDRQENPFVTYLARLGDETVLLGFRDVIFYMTQIAIDKFSDFLEVINEENSSLLSTISTPLMSLFSTTTEKKPSFDHIALLNIGVEHYELFAFTRQLISANNDFITFMTVAQKEDEPEYLLNQFLSLSSFVFACFKGDSENEIAKKLSYYCLYIINQCIEDHYTQNIVSNQKLNSILYMMRADLPHRPFIIDDKFANGSKLIEYITELLTEFMLSHKMKKFPYAHYELCFNVLHHLLLRLRGASSKLGNWENVIKTLMGLVKFIIPKIGKENGEHIVEYSNTLQRLLIILNFFIAHGDTFLPDSEAYNYLYYEIIRSESVFQTLRDIVTNSQDIPELTAVRRSILRMSTQLENITLIQSFFKDIFDKNSLDFPSEENIRQTIKDNIGDMTLRLYAELEIVDKIASFNRNFNI